MRLSNKIDMIGKRFGRLLVLEEVGKNKSGFHYRCKCDCGNESVVLGQNLRNGSTKSCGCLRRDTDSWERIRHRRSRRY